MISPGRCKRCLDQEILIDVEDRLLIFGIGSAQISVVTQHQPQIGVIGTRKVIVGISHRKLPRPRSTEVADAPNSKRRCASHHWRGDKKVIQSIAGKILGIGSYCIVVLGIGVQTRQGDLMVHHAGSTDHQI